MKIISPCVSVCVTVPLSGYCYGCARTEEEKIFWKDPDTNLDWKQQNLSILESRMSGFQLEAFKASYANKINSGISLIKQVKLTAEEKQ